MTAQCPSLLPMRCASQTFVPCHRAAANFPNPERACRTFRVDAGLENPATSFAPSARTIVIGSAIYALRSPTPEAHACTVSPAAGRWRQRMTSVGAVSPAFLPVSMALSRLSRPQTLRPSPLSPAAFPQSPAPSPPSRTADSSHRTQTPPHPRQPQPLRARPPDSSSRKSSPKS